MARCNSNHNLVVHHIKRDGGNNLNNAEVLCSVCYSNITTLNNPGPGEPILHEGTPPPPFAQQTINEALARAHNRCECERLTCLNH
jgi:hypothetical protein